MRTIFLTFLTLTITATLLAQSLNSVQLNSYSKSKGVDIMVALQKRQSTRVFDTKELTVQDLSDLLWAANGINRPESGKRTAPSAINSQDVDVYVLKSDGAYLYDAIKHSINQITTEDLRSLCDGNRPSGAPVILLLVSDISRYRNYKADDVEANKHISNMSILDAGIVSQNISLFCAAANLATVPRAGMNQDGLKKALNLKPSQSAWLNHPVGYFKN